MVAIHISRMSTKLTDFSGTGRPSSEQWGVHTLPPTADVGGKKDQACLISTWPTLLFSREISC